MGTTARLPRAVWCVPLIKVFDHLDSVEVVPYHVSTHSHTVGDNKPLVYTLSRMGTWPCRSLTRKPRDWIVHPDCITCVIIPLRIHEISPSVLPKSQRTNQEEPVLRWNCEVSLGHPDQRSSWKLKLHISAYTGYIDIEARHIFFYFFESRSNPATDDVIFWTNGGMSMVSIGLVSSSNVCNYKDLAARRLLGYLWNLVRFDSCCSVYWDWNKHTLLKVHVESRGPIALNFILNHGTQTQTSSSLTSRLVSGFHTQIMENMW